MKMSMGLLLVTMALPVHAAQLAGETGNTRITSDSLEMNFNPKQIFVYMGDVLVVDPEIDLLCDKMTVTFNDRKKQQKERTSPVIQLKTQPEPKKPPMMSQGGQIKEIVAEINVVIINKKDKTRATGQKGVFTAANNLLVLTGNPILYQGDNKIAGEVIVWDRVTGKLKVTKAKVDISQGKDDKKPAPKR
jgi:lipopolysaccharide transport protein LptA